MTTATAHTKLFDTHSEDREWDYVIIGSGMGGLATGALLSRLGRRCLVLEQHYVPGGFTHTFKRKRWLWDVGVHAVGEVDDRAMLGRILRDLTRGELEWASLGGVYDEFYFPDLRIDFPDSRAQFEANLNAAFPSQQGPIREYLSKVREVSAAMRSYYLSRILPPQWAPLADPLLARRAHEFLTHTTKEVLDTITTDEKLQSVLTAQWGYYGVLPERSSFAIHALTARHFFNGGFYPVGGAARIAETLMATIASTGGFTRIRASVKEIVLRDGAATGVVLDSGESIRAKHVVSAAGALATVSRLLPESERQKPWARSIMELKPTPAHLCLYLGFKGDIRTAGATASNKWFYETWDSNAKEWDLTNDAAEAPVLYCSFPSLKDPHHDPGPDQLHTGEVVTFVPYDTFARWRDGRWRRRGEDYDALKQRLTDAMLKQFLRHMPGLKPMIAFAELSTPISTEHFTRAPAGAIYGLEPTPQRYRTAALRPRTPVKNLFLSGADMASVGVMGAFVGGVLSAVSAEPLPAIQHLRRVLRPGR